MCVHQHHKLIDSCIIKFCMLCIKIDDLFYIHNMPHSQVNEEIRLAKHSQKSLVETLVTSAKKKKSFER